MWRVAYWETFEKDCDWLYFLLDTAVCGKYVSVVHRQFEKRFFNMSGMGLGKTLNAKFVKEF